MCVRPRLGVSILSLSTIFRLTFWFVPTMVVFFCCDFFCFDTFHNLLFIDTYIVRDSSAVRRLFVRLAGAVGRQSALHKKNSGFAAPTLGRHIYMFRGKRSNKMYLSIFMSSLEVWLLAAGKYIPINNKLSQLWLYGLDAISSLKSCGLYSQYLTIIWSLSFLKLLKGHF
jgi:hypothetical protein